MNTPCSFFHNDTYRFLLMAPGYFIMWLEYSVFIFPFLMNILFFRTSFFQNHPLINHVNISLFVCLSFCMVVFIFLIDRKPEGALLKKNITNEFVQKITVNLISQAMYEGTFYCLVFGYYNSFSFLKNELKKFSDSFFDCCISLSSK